MSKSMPSPNLVTSESSEIQTWVCVHCGYPLQRVYTIYSKGNIQLETCPECHRFADPYMECDSVLIFVDMLLQKRGAYRHVLYNLSTTTSSTFVPKLGTCLFLFEVYLRLLRMSKSHDPLHTFSTGWSTFRLDIVPADYVVQFIVAEWLPSPIRTISLVLSQYLGVLTTTFLEFALVYGSIRMYFYLFHSLYPSSAFSSSSSSSSSLSFLSLSEQDKVLQAMFLSSFGRLILLLVVIWEPQKLNPEHINYVWIINAYVLLSNTEALCAIKPEMYWKVLFLLIVSHFLSHIFTVSFLQYIFNPSTSLHL